MSEKKHGTLVYIADVSALEDRELYDAIYGRVREERKAKTDRLRFDRDRRLSLGAEYLLMCACREFGIDYDKATITEDANLKPVFKDIPIHFNLSHSGERVMCIMSEYPVGCDIEKASKADMVLAEKYFHEKEYRMLKSCEDAGKRNAMFYRLWTLKESFAKCTGLGLHLPMNSFAVDISGEGVKLEQSVSEDKFSLFEYGGEEGYACAWCIRTEKEGELSDEFIGCQIIGIHE